MTNYDDKTTAAAYVNSRRPDEAVLAALLKRLGALTPRAAVLDFGCGTGTYLAAVKRATGRPCYGVDPSLAMLDIAAEQDEALALAKGDHRCIPLGDASIDLAYMVDVIHHVGDMGAMFDELSRVLAPGGALLVFHAVRGPDQAALLCALLPRSDRRGPCALPEPRFDRGQGRGLGLTMRMPAGAAARRGSNRRSLPQALRERSYSMLRLISDEEWEDGVSPSSARSGAAT
jgi:SAM-dependent methyltransferase